MMSLPLATEIVVKEAWTIVDKWWTKDEVIRKEYVVADWQGREIVFIKIEPCKTWRIWKAP